MAARRALVTRRRPGGRVEQDPEEILRRAVECLESAARIADRRGPPGRSGAPGLGIATQRSTVLFWDRDTGRPLTPAYSWQDLRGSALCARIARRAGRARDVADRTGLRLSPHYSASKIAWAMRHVPGLRRKVAAGRALWGPLGSFILWRLTEGAVYAVDHANAQRTLLVDLPSLAWDPSLFDLFGLEALLDAPALPALVPTSPSTEIEVTLREGGARLRAVTGDQQAALLVLGCRGPGEVCINYGSGAFVLRNVGAAPVRSAGLLTTILASWSEPDRGPGAPAARFALEGTVNSAATAIDWAERRLGIRVRTAELDRFLGPDDGRSRTVHFLPAVAGLGAPRWDPAARPRFAGDVARASPRDLLRAVVESIACRCAEIVRASDAERPPRDRALSIRRDAPVLVAGGLVRCATLLQAQADLLGRPLLVSTSPDATALGAAVLAGRGPLRLFQGADRSRPAAGAEEGRIVRPRLSRAEAEARFRTWERAVYGPDGGGGREAGPAAGAPRRGRIVRS